MCFIFSPDRSSLCGLQERPGSFQRRTILIGVHRLRDKIGVKGPGALAVAGSLGRLRGSIEAPEAAGLISEVRFERLQRLPRSITFEQQLSKQLARGDDGTGNYWISFSIASSRSAAVRNICSASSRLPCALAIQAVTIWRWTSICVSH